MNAVTKYRLGLSNVVLYHNIDSCEAFVKVTCRHLHHKGGKGSGGFDVDEGYFEFENYFENYECMIKPNIVPNCIRCFYSKLHNHLDYECVEILEQLIKSELS